MSARFTNTLRDKTGERPLRVFQIVEAEQRQHCAGCALEPGDQDASCRGLNGLLLPDGNCWSCMEGFGKILKEITR